VFARVWLCLIKCEDHQTFDQKLKTFILLSCMMGVVLFVWTAAYQTCLMRACVPRLLSGLYQLLDLCLIKHVLTVWRLTSKSALKAWTNGKCLATKHHQTLFGDQSFYRLDTLFGVVWSCLIVFGRV